MAASTLSKRPTLATPIECGKKANIGESFGESPANANAGITSYYGIAETPDVEQSWAAEAEMNPDYEQVAEETAADAQKKKEDKAHRKEERKANATGGDFEIAYVDEYGNFSSTPPDPMKRKIVVNASSIEVGVPDPR